MATPAQEVRKKRLVIELDPREHKAIKAKALLLGVSMKEYVLQQLRNDNAFDLEDVTNSVAEALKEVKQYKEKSVGLREKPEAARSFLDSL
jgi:hypothetical protein